MTVDWKLSQLQRDAKTKREQLVGINANLEGLEVMLQEARSFEGYFSEKIAALERQIVLCGPMYEWTQHGPVRTRKVTEEDVAREKDLNTQLANLIRERDAELERRTTRSQHGHDTLTFCALKSDHVITHRARVVGIRDQVARELADIEAQLTPGEIVQSGVPAQEYTDYRAGVAAMRARMGISSESAS